MINRQIFSLPDKFSQLSSHNSKRRRTLHKMRLLTGLLAYGVSADGIPQYGPTRGDRCLTPRDNDSGKYTMQRAIESFNYIEAECLKIGQNASLSKVLLKIFRL